LWGCSGGSGSSDAASTGSPAVVSAPPTIIDQPPDLSVSAGEQATFRVLAEGSQPLAYQWQRNGQEVPGATASSFTTPPLEAGDDAIFSVVITNEAGTVTSRDAQLVVGGIAITVDSVDITTDSTRLSVDHD
jgi:hypothetical protein